VHSSVKSRELVGQITWVSSVKSQYLSVKSRVTRRSNHVPAYFKGVETNDTSGRCVLATCFFHFTSQWFLTDIPTRYLILLRILKVCEWPCKTTLFGIRWLVCLEQNNRT